VADVSGPTDGGQSIGRATDERAGLGLLSRFLGAVFLVLLGGLLLLDRALLRANRNQTRLDVQSAALLTEAFMASQGDLLDRIAGIAAHGIRAKDSVAFRAAAERLVHSMPAVRHLWATDSAGRLVLDVEGPSGVRLPSSLLADLHGRRALDHTLVAVAPAPNGRRYIWLMRPTSTSTSISASAERPGSGGTTGLVVDGAALTALLNRVHPDTRLTLAVLAGADTVALLGEPGHGADALSEHESTTARLPNGGAWGVVATHALTSRSLRWGLWTFGVLGVLFLAIGLLREQRRALQVADRSLELERLYSDVKRANQAKSEFLANVSHELRTPLNAIVGFVELLRDGFYGDLSPRQVPPVDRIAASATHLRHLVDQVLDIAKIAAGRLEVHPETIVLRPFVLNVASELESLVAERGLAFSISVGASLPRVRTDPTHLRQILINLIGNAVKYTPAGTLSIRARLLGAPRATNVRTTPTRSGGSGGDDAAASALLSRAPRSGTWVALQVVDSGVGIAAADLERIFDEFEQVNAGPRGDSMQRGTGLGLAISRRLARLLGGEISVESEPGRGSTFTVWLPVNPADLIRERPDPAAPAPALVD
jgi:signal transduction histidine kinase